MKPPESLFHITGYALWSRCTGNFIPDSEVHGANMGPTWGRQEPGGPHVDHVNLATWDYDVINIFRATGPL